MGLDIKKIKTAIVVLADILAIFFSYQLAYLIRFGELAGFFEKFPAFFLLLMALGYVAVFYFFDLYSFPLRFRRFTLGGQVVLATLLASVVVLLLKYIFFLLPIGRGILLMADLIIVALVLGIRHITRFLFKFLVQPRSVIIIGKGKAALQIGRLISAFGDDFKLVGYLEQKSNPSQEARDPKSPETIGTFGDIAGAIQRYGVKLVVLSESGIQNDHLIHSLLYAQLGSVEVTSFTDLFQNLTGKIPIDFIEDEDWFLKTKGFNLANHLIVRRLKWLMDVSISGLLLILSLPLWPFIALAIRVDSKGPVFYSQTRVGKKEAHFSLYKFRSMIEDAEEKEPIWAREDDQRITRVGRVLRKLHLDEVPQLWNILKGEMSIVGPRPERPEFVELLKEKIPYYSLRHFVKPGLTGWAQINYLYAASLEDSKEKLEYDLFYIAHMSLLLDAKIIMRTARSFLFGKPQSAAAETKGGGTCEEP